MRSLAIDDQGSRLSDKIDQREVAHRRLARLAMIHCEGPKNLPAGGQDRNRPAGPKSVRERHIPEIFPQGIGRNVGHEHRRPGESGSSA